MSLVEVQSEEVCLYFAAEDVKTLLMSFALKLNFISKNEKIHFINILSSPFILSSHFTPSLHFNLAP